MRAVITNRFFRQTILAFAGMPLLIWAMGNLPARTMLKETLSVITVLAFFQTIGQFFWARTNKYSVKNIKMGKLINYHKFIGYTFAIALLLHPVLLVIPRFFEAGISPAEAFLTTITTFTSRGVVFGIIAWCLLLILGITSITRRKLPMTYKTWRVFHGLLASLFTAVAAWHVIDLGRHSSFTMSALIIFFSVFGVLLLVKTYTSKTIQKPEKDK